MKLEAHPFIRSVSEKRRAGILEDVERLRLKEGDPIFDEGSAPDALYLVLEGRIRFWKRKRDGSRQPVSECEAGGFFGEVGVFTGERRALGAEAASEAVVGRVPEATVKKIIEDAEPVRKILESVIAHLNNTTRHYIEDVMRAEKLGLVGTMVSSILHDFKNPFAVISLGSHMIRKRHGDDPRTASICANIESQIRRMVDMANDLSAFARGSDQIEIAPVSMEKLFEAYRELNAPYFEDDSVEIAMRPNGAWLTGDSTKLLRVLQNLVGNAIEAAGQRRGAGPARVEVEAKEDGGAVWLRVADNGPGIPEAIRDKVFEPFVTHGKPDGTGLGTAIVKSIVDAHGGAIDFTTGPEGTAFEIRLPKRR